MAHKRVLLIRHGLTARNLEKRYIGRKSDEALSELGKSLSEKAAKALGETPGFNKDGFKIYASPLKRATETAGILFGENRIITPIEELTEIDFGDFEGLNYNDLKENRDYQLWIDSGGKMAFPNGEDRDEFIERSFRGFFKAIENDLEKEVAIVCHGGNIMSILSRITGKDYFDFMTPNLGGYILEFELENERISEFTLHSFDLGSDS